MLWGGRDTADKYCWHLWGVLTVDGPHWVCHSPRQHVLPRSTLLRLQPALQGHCPKWTLCLVHLPALSCSGSQVLCKGTDPDGLCILCSSQVQAAQATGCLVSVLSPGGFRGVHLISSLSQLLGFLGAQWERRLTCAVCLLSGADLCL